MTYEYTVKKIIGYFNFQLVTEVSMQFYFPECCFVFYKILQVTVHLILIYIASI